MRKNLKLAELNISIVTVNFNTLILKRRIKCLFCSNNYLKSFDEKLMERFLNTDKYSDQ